jgi:membrane protein implicated in regulation of membrane protease activity
MIVALCGGGLTYQLIVLALASLIAFVVFGEKFAKLQRERANKRSHRTNADALIGVECEVTEDIPLDGKGRVKVDGDNWPACGINGEAIPTGSRVRIVSRDSIVMTVQRM